MGHLYREFSLLLHTLKKSVCFSPVINGHLDVIFYTISYKRSVFLILRSFFEHRYVSLFFTIFTVFSSIYI